MSYINYSAREINLKIVVLGGVREGKAHPLERLYDDLPAAGRGKLTSLGAPGSDQTIFFESLPEGIEPVREFHTRVHLFGGAGRGIEGSHLNLLLKGADGVIFLGLSVPGQAAIEARLVADGIPYVKPPASEHLKKTITDFANVLIQSTH